MWKPCGVPGEGWWPLGCALRLGPGRRWFERRGRKPGTIQRSVRPWRGGFVGSGFFDPDGLFDVVSNGEGQYADGVSGQTKGACTTRV